MELFAGDFHRSSGAHQLQLFSSGSVGDVSYSCGCCGYQLNLNSSNRTSVGGSKYEKCMKKGIISFFSIDETRFNQTDEVQYLPYFKSRHSWGFLRRRSKLLCKKCGNHVGNAYKTQNSSWKPLKLEKFQFQWDGICDSRIYDMKIYALQPSSLEE